MFSDVVQSFNSDTHVPCSTPQLNTLATISVYRNSLFIKQHLFIKHIASKSMITPGVSQFRPRMYQYWKSGIGASLFCSGI